MNINQRLRDGHESDTHRRRNRVLAAISQAQHDGADLTVAAIARRANVNRSFLYRHRDLLTSLHTAQTEPPPGNATSPAVTRASLIADLANTQARTSRLQTRVHQLEHKLSELLGQQVWRESGLGAPTDVEQFQLRIVHLEQQTVDLATQRDQLQGDLDAARAANRQLMAQLNGRRT